MDLAAQSHSCSLTLCSEAAVVAQTETATPPSLPGWGTKVHLAASLRLICAARSFTSVLQATDGISVFFIFIFLAAPRSL